VFTVGEPELGFDGFRVAASGMILPGTRVPAERFP